MRRTRRVIAMPEAQPETDVEESPAPSAAIECLPATIVPEPADAEPEARDEALPVLADGFDDEDEEDMAEFLARLPDAPEMPFLRYAGVTLQASFTFRPMRRRSGMAGPCALPVERPAPRIAAPVPKPPMAAAPASLPAPAPERIRAEPTGAYEFPPLELLTEPTVNEPAYEASAEYLDRSSVTLQQTLHDFGVRGEIIDANPGPVVTLYELEPAPGTKSSRVIGLSNDIARSMSAVSARVAVVPGRNVIGIELPNQTRETVYLRELLETPDFSRSKHRLAVALGKTIGGEPIIADLARMPHLLVAGTTGSGKSVAINTMILSLLYTHTPEECRLIMVDPKMLELSVYEGIPHLLTPVVTDPKKAVVALKWAVREMEERYRKMSRLGVRNIDGFNGRVAEMIERGENADLDEAADGDALKPLPYIVVIVDEMADLMMVAGKDIEGAIQRLAQMARAAGIHLIMATQRPSVDVITGTIKANFPTRISFQVTSKIDSRTILGEMGAEQLLGQGDMLYMAGGGRITRVHGPFVSDSEVEKVVAHLKAQGRPEYLEAVTDEEEAGGPAPLPEDMPVEGESVEFGDDENGPYEQAVQVVLRDKKASTSYIQRRLGIGYNRAASIMERMEKEGIVGPANHAGKRAILRGEGRHGLPD
ncbi:DNA translocase FtsK [Enterovirga sp. CN4-39]|uniref:DNA translocase FtsK n=1 Tax=Enterovirga sp. CN4-39 TaxID=3400910 RepID=UPI003C06D813